MKPTVGQMISAAQTAAKIDGCTCTPDVNVREVQPGVFSASIAHDAWCRHPSQRKSRKP